MDQGTATGADYTVSAPSVTFNAGDQVADDQLHGDG